MEDCIFCKIVKGDLPSYKVFEDDDVLAILDIMPVNPGHVLVIPKQHYPNNIIELPEDLACKIVKTIKIITPIILKAVDASDFNLGLNNGKLAGQLINHFHWHIMPRFPGDGHELWKGSEYDEGEITKVLKKIKSNL
ncbi:MAG: HIT domain-containing protein [Candidatus Buchananbacteria bacterium]